jgi:glutathione S-transferase
VPVIVDDGEWVLDSWLIAEYLDEKYPTGRGSSRGRA